MDGTGGLELGGRAERDGWINSEHKNKGWQPFVGNDHRLAAQEVPLHAGVRASACVRARASRAFAVCMHAWCAWCAWYAWCAGVKMILRLRR